MQRAIRLARRGAGHVEPNPMVGCVILRGGRVVGEGWHRRFGGPHAEVQALRAAAAGAGARGATAVVTLEPCHHTGKTPPCTAALIEAGVTRVVVGSRDPHPAGGGGAATLRRAGIDVVIGVRAEQAGELIAPFVKRTVEGLPYTILKWAATLDGATATASGDSQWISNDRCRRYVHRLRGRVDAILVGIATALADNPQLTARGVRARRIARRVVIDPRARLPLDSRLIATLDQAPLTLAIDQARLDRGGRKLDQLRERGVELVGLPPGKGRGDRPLRPLLEHLAAEHAATNLLVEGGARTAGALVDQGLADEILAFIAPKLLADGTGLPPLRRPTNPARHRLIADCRGLKLLSLRRIDGDALARYRVKNA